MQPEVGEKRENGINQKINEQFTTKLLLQSTENLTERSRLKSCAWICVYSFIVQCYLHLQTLSCLNPEGLWLGKQWNQTGFFFLLILCFDAQIWLSSSQKVTPKAGHQSWQADVLWPFYICFAAAWGFGIWVCCNHILLMNSWAHAWLPHLLLFFPHKRWDLRMGRIRASHFVPEQDISTPTVHIAIAY